MTVVRLTEPDDTGRTSKSVVLMTFCTMVTFVKLAEEISMEPLTYGSCPEPEDVVIGGGNVTRVVVNRFVRLPYGVPVHEDSKAMPEAFLVPDVLELSRETAVEAFVGEDDVFPGAGGEQT